MPTHTEQKFDELLKEVFAGALKPLGYKKKASNFYVFNGEIGKIINIQKSVNNSKDHIQFTINTGIFSPEYWKAQYNYRDEPVPAFPTEPVCVIRARIGELLKQSDLWYDLTSDSSPDALKKVLDQHLRTVILPYFDTFMSNDDLLKKLETSVHAGHPARLIVLAELKRWEEAKEELQKLLSLAPRPNLLRIIQDRARQYGLM